MAVSFDVEQSNVGAVFNAMTQRLAYLEEMLADMESERNIYKVLYEESIKLEQEFKDAMENGVTD